MPAETGMEKRMRRPWWLSEGTEPCHGCTERYALQAVLRCTGCDRCYCEHCVVVIRATREVYCPECADGAGEG